MEIVFDKNWFRTHQKSLLWFANTRVGRWVLRINGKRSSVGKRRIIRIEPNAIWWGKRAGENLHLTAEFRTNEKFARRLYFAFKPVWWIMHFLDWLLLDRFEWMKRWNFGFATLTQYPWSIANDNPCDGYTGRTASNETFTAIRGGVGVSGSNSNLLTGLYAGSTSLRFNEMYRGIACFDTSSLTAGATISSATFSGYGFLKFNNIGSDNLHAVSSTPGSTTSAPVSTDYGAFGNTSFGSVSYAAFSTSGYNDFTLNASGISNISKTAISQFGTKLGWDISGSFGGGWMNGQVTAFYTYAATETGTTQDPKLVVNYTVATAATGNFFFLF